MAREREREREGERGPFFCFLAFLPYYPMLLLLRFLFLLNRKEGTWKGLLGEGKGREGKGRGERRKKRERREEQL